jgi:hypothetical protein
MSAAASREGSARPKEKEEDVGVAALRLGSSSGGASPAVKAESPAPVKAEAGVKDEGPSGAGTPAPVRDGPQLIGDLPLATDAALATFEVLADNHYQYGTLGRSREAMEGMACDCVYTHGAALFIIGAVAPGADRAQARTSRGPRAARARTASTGSRRSSACRTSAAAAATARTSGPRPPAPPARRADPRRRFAKKEYAPIEIVQTEKKGFGLRAAANLPKYAVRGSGGAARR